MYVRYVPAPAPAAGHRSRSPHTSIRLLTTHIHITVEHHHSHHSHDTVLDSSTPMNAPQKQKEMWIRAEWLVDVDADATVDANDSSLCGCVLIDLDDEGWTERKVVEGVGEGVSAGIWWWWW